MGFQPLHIGDLVYALDGNQCRIHVHYHEPEIRQFPAVRHEAIIKPVRKTVGRNSVMRLRCGQAIGALGDLLALPALRQFGEMVEMRRGYIMGSLDDKVHVFERLKNI